jgi:hypothetical protein
MVPEKRRKQIKANMTYRVGTRCPTQAPTGARMKDAVMIGIPSLKSRRFSRMLE